jgi:hypothetical protein
MAGFPASPLDHPRTARRPPGTIPRPAENYPNIFKEYMLIVPHFPERCNGFFDIFLFFSLFGENALCLVENIYLITICKIFVTPKLFPCYFI